MLALAWAMQAAQLADRPAFAFHTASPSAQTADCVVQSLRGKRLGVNIFTLRPQLSRVFEGYAIQIGPDIRVTVEPAEVGSSVRLYTDRFLEPLSEAISKCEIQGSADPIDIHDADAGG